MPNPFGFIKFQDVLTLVRGMAWGGTETGSRQAPEQCVQLVSLEAIIQSTGATMAPIIYQWAIERVTITIGFLVVIGLLVRQRSGQTPQLYDSTRNPGPVGRTVRLAREYSQRACEMMPPSVQLPVWGVYRRKIRFLEERSTFTMTRDDAPIAKPEPRVGWVPQPEDLHSHVVEGRSIQVWMRTENGEWTSVHQFFPHPRLGGYMLQISENGNATWVKEVTAYKNARGRTKVVASQTSS
ncbi:uncharacterized protein FIBRA_09015 [Fibroporia radiculosa]|uniref:Uncharacterized protein n=1 Tax=Fibroporia radiculosa TaxID=599839 RepID=J4ICN5_9APHY|nr:uncharacterized protein FIBRA_09015 [Fibroporia radiculosa]CCM06721.1 predicted protein [Fibroporia radiculosa]